MKALDVCFMVKELQSLIGAKIDKVYQQEEELIIVFHKQGKILLKITPEACFITKYKFEQEKPPSFCMNLRKHLSQARVTEIVQRGFERIIEMRLKKEQEYILIVELFSKGNVILCQPNFQIMIPLHEQVWKDRTIKPKVTYIYPPRLKYDPLEFKEQDLERIGKENLVKSLAIDFGLGGDYAEETCLRAGVDKDKTQLTGEEIKKIMREIKHIAEEKLNPNRVENEVYSFELQLHKGKEKKFYSTLSEALDEYCKEGISEDKSFEKKKKRIEELLEKQKQHVEGLKKSAEQDKIKGDLIYSNYAYIKEVIDTIRKARDSKISWEEITKKLKTKNIEVNKGGKVILDLK